MTEEKSKDKKVWIAVIIVIIIALVFLAYITYKPEPKPTNVEVTSISRKMGYSIDEVVVTVSIFNHDNSGTVTIWVELRQDNSWKKAKTVSIDSRESMDLTFVFSGLDPYREIELRGWTEA